MIDRLVCADGGNPDPTSPTARRPSKAKAIELQGWDYPKHLAGRVPTAWWCMATWPASKARGAPVRLAGLDGAGRRGPAAGSTATSATTSRTPPATSAGRGPCGGRGGPQHGPRGGESCAGSAQGNIERAGPRPATAAAERCSPRSPGLLQLRMRSQQGELLNRGLADLLQAGSGVGCKAFEDRSIFLSGLSDSPLPKSFSACEPHAEQRKLSPPQANLCMTDALTGACG